MLLQQCSSIQNPLEERFLPFPPLRGSREVFLGGAEQHERAGLALTYTADTCPHAGTDTTSVYEAAVYGSPSNCVYFDECACVFVSAGYCRELKWMEKARRWTATALCAL